MQTNLATDALNLIGSPEEYAEPGNLEVDPDLFPLTTKTAGRVAILKGAGNAIVPAAAAIWILSVMDIVDDQ